MAKSKTYYEKTGPGEAVSTTLPEDTLKQWSGALNGLCTDQAKIDFYDGNDQGFPGTVYAEVTNEQAPTENLAYVIDGETFYLNTTTGLGPNSGARVEVPLGTASVSQGSFINILHNSGAPTLSATIAFPVVENALLSNQSLFDYTRTLSEGVFAFLRTNDDIDGTTYEGMVRNIVDTMRIKLGSTWFNGVDGTPTVNDLNIKLATSFGFIRQLHLQPFDAQDGNSYWVYNDETNTIVYDPSANLTDITQDANGGTFLTNNTYYRLCVFGMQNSPAGGAGGVVDRLIVTRPLGSYTSSAEALLDPSNFDVSINDLAVEGIVAPLYTMVIGRTGGAGATINLIALQDNRNRLAGGGGGAGSSGGLFKGSALLSRSFAAGTINTNDPFDFANTEIFNDSNSIVVLGNTQIQLLAGKKYMLEGSINITSSSNGFLNHQFYNITAAAYFGVEGTLIVSTNVGNSGSTTQAKAMIAPMVNTTIELRNQAGDSATQYAAVVEVQEL